MASANTPSVEMITPNAGSSFSIKHFDSPTIDTLGRYWHCHPELELVYVNEGSGKRHIGNHLSYYANGELVLIGSNLPHSGFSDRLNGGQKETVIQFHPHFLGKNFFHLPENQSIQKLLELSKKGISFSKNTRNKLGPQIEDLMSLPPFTRMLSLIDLLYQLSIAEEKTILNAEGVALSVDKQDNDRMRMVFNYVKENFQEVISLAEVAQLVNLTEPSFSRYFKNSTGKTFTSFVNEYRLVHATKLLNEKDLTISQVAVESGFNNFSHFNKKFQEKYGQTASEYRKNVKELLS